MALTKKQKAYIRKNHKQLKTEELAKRTKASKKDVTKYIKRFATYKKEKAPFTIDSLKALWTFIRGNLPFVILLAVICLTIYANALQAEFVSDDIEGYVFNTPVQTLSSVFSSYKIFGLQPILYAIMYQTFGANPVPLHITSLILHIINVILLFILGYMLFGKKPAIISSLLFATHPLNTEAVTWISGINYLWNATTLFLVLILHTLYVNSKNYKYALASALCFGIGGFLIKNAWLMVVPFLLVIVDQIILRRKTTLKETFKYALPYGIACISFFAVLILPLILPRVQYVEGQTISGPQAKAPLIIHVPYTFLMTAKLLIFPKDLTLYHEGELITQTFITIARLSLIIFAIAMPFILKANKKVAGLLLIITLALLPSFSPLQVAWYMAERYLYASAAFFAILVALFILKVEKTTKWKKFAVISTGFLLVIYSIRTIVRNNEWRTPKNLWLATARVAENSPRVYNNLGDIYASENDFEKSIEMFEKAIELAPNYPDATHNLGRTYLLKGDLDKAEELFNKALELHPLLYQSYHMLGFVEYQRGNVEKARTYFQKALEINPQYQDAQNALDVLNNAP